MKKDKKEKKIKKQKVELLIKLLDIENQIKKSNKVEIIGNSQSFDFVEIFFGINEVRNFF